MTVTSPLIKLENTLAKLEDLVKLLQEGLNESDETIKPVDAFLLTIYRNSWTSFGNNSTRPRDIDTQLRGLHLAFDTLLNEHVLVSDLRGTYQSIPDGNKSDYFRRRLQVVMETSNSIFDKMMFVEEHTVGFAPSIKAAKERATPAYIDSFVEKTEDEGKHGYIECMPKTLHIASAIIWLLPNIRNLVGNTAILVMDFWQECYGQQPTYNNLFRETTLKKDYRSLFSSDEDARTCLLLMNHFGLIHTDGAHRIGDRAKYNLLAFVEALQKKDLLPSTQIIEKITATLADQISLQYPRPRKDKVEEYKYNECLRIHLGKINEIDTGRITWPTVNQWLADDGR